MIITRIQGGLGNQMFQYATGRAFSYLYNEELYLDISGLERHVEGHLDRGFMLNSFNIKAIIASQQKLKLFKKGTFWNNLINKQKNHIKQLVFEEIPENISHFKNAHLIVKPYTYIFNPDILERKKGDIYLDGYWQSFKYFKAIEPILKNEFQFKSVLSAAALQMTEKIKSCLSISIHFRRTDYISTDFGNKFFKPVLKAYYDKALEIFESKFDKLSLFVFSDDIEWCKANFATPHETYYISSESPVEDLRLMSCCKHNIIANSTFSWWAAWLNNNPDKIVISPSKWFQNVENDNIDDLLPEAWIKID